MVNLAAYVWFNVLWLMFNGELNCYFNGLRLIWFLIDNLMVNVTACGQFNVLWLMVKGKFNWYFNGLCTGYLLISWWIQRLMVNSMFNG